MTDPHKPTNPLFGQNRTTGSTPAFTTLKDTGEQVPTEMYAYCAWLNAKEQRRGIWVVIEVGEKKLKSIEFRPQIASDDWLREKGLAPRIGRAA